MNPTSVAVIGHAADRALSVFFGQPVADVWENLDLDDQQTVIDNVTDLIAEFPTATAQAIARKYAAGGPGIHRYN